MSMIKQFMKDRKGIQKIKLKSGGSAISVQHYEGPWHCCIVPDAEIRIGGHPVSDSLAIMFLGEEAPAKPKKASTEKK